MAAVSKIKIPLIRSGFKTTPQADKPRIAPKFKVRADEKAQSAGGG
jgi:hypothetical protein